MNKCSFKINMFAFLIMTALLNTVVCSKISLVDESFREEASQLTFRSRLAGFCSIGAATEGYLQTDCISKILLLLKLLFFIDVFELALSSDYHPTSVMIVQGVIFFHLKMPVNSISIGWQWEFLITVIVLLTKKISISRKVIMWE